ncbi:hypothetical protein [Microlunatus antarcticus]|uniref:Uncharacterized protein n=1 Tax=Microlunatus antarcticus TaxID=53388 RepID=A0A7W5P7F9_9ACTN|nr:hypothetical protein [Microlunatus antarcticus]MBB3326811.1 hypothetical protein [Microlunatus antarcticus]
MVDGLPHRTWRCVLLATGRLSCVPPRPKDERPPSADDAVGLVVKSDQGGSPFPGQEVDPGAARAWVRHQFAGMSVLLEQVVSRLDTLPRARALVAAETSDDLVLDGTGHRFPQSVSTELARDC